MESLINVINKDGQMVVSSREVAKNFEKQHKDVLEAIEKLIDGVAENSANPLNAENTLLFIPSKYQHEQNKQWYKEYLLTRDGFSLLVMGFTGSKALEWKLKYIEAFNKMAHQLTNLDNLSPQLQLLINIELQQKQMQTQITQVNQRIDGIKEIVGLSIIGWREDARALIVKIAEQWGGHDYIAEVNKAIYKELDSRLGVNLKQRRINKRHRLADEGIPKSKQDKISYVDVIADDKKLIEGYVAIVKEMAIKYGVADEVKGA